MRIALIGCTINPRVGGMGRALYDHAVALAEAGQEVMVYTLDAPHPNLLPKGEKGLRIVRLKSLVHIGKAAWGVRFDPPLDAYDVVHLHLPFFGVAERVARWRCAVILEERAQRAVLERSDRIGSINQLDSIGPPEAGLQNDRGEAGVRDDKRGTILVATYHMDAIGIGLKRAYFNWWYRHRFKKVLAACDAIAVTSRAYARDSQLARAGIDVEKCEEILLRVDTGRFAPHPSPLPQGEREPYFLFVGALDRAHYFKGLSVLLRAMMQLPDTRLVVVGAGELLAQYKKEAAGLGIADRVHFTGGITDEELARWYAGARALVLPSTDRSEAFGIVLIEAMACGTPVIASDLPGVREVVERVQGGVLVASPTKDRIKLDSSASGLRMTNTGTAPRNDSVGAPRNDMLAAALQEMWQHPWSDDERAALAARTAATYGRATLAEQLLKWYNQTHVPSR